MTQISSERIALIEARKHELAQAMSSPNLAPDEFVRLSKDYAAIEPVAAAAREVRRLRAELEVLNGMLHDASAEAELKEMAAAEADEIRHKLPDAERALAVRLLPRDAADERAAMLEVRPAREAMRLRCSRGICCACTSVSQKCRAGDSS